MKNAIMDPNLQFKKERVSKKLDYIKDHINDTPGPNVYETITGQSLTPLLMGRVQLVLCLKSHNLVAIRGELPARGVTFDGNTNYTDIKKLLQEDEKKKMKDDSTYDKRYFKPVTRYENFKWNENHFDE